MKNPLQNVYEQMLLTEAEKFKLQSPSSDEVGNLKSNNDLFGTKPKPVEGPEKAKLSKGPAYKETTGTSSSPKGSSSSMPKSAPAKAPKVEKGEEMEDTEVDPTDHSSKEEEDEENYKKTPRKENFTMSAFETLFKKTLMTEEVDEVPAEGDPIGSEGADVDLEDEPMEDEEEEASEEEEGGGDLVSDLRDLQDKLASILDKLEGLEEEEGEEESEEYSEEEFDNEFGDEGEEEEAPGEPYKESLDRPKPLSSSKGKTLQNKKNKVGGKLSAKKGGKAHTGHLKYEPSPKPLGDKKKPLQSKSNQVRSSVKKGDFLK